ncbi:MAG: hypothetical protein JRM80_00160 [Nitrososphaerota archaeon]|nr:hypothetical protein [Nitrososphaerota archaeon]
MDSDDVAYRKSVRNMSIILAVMVITIFAAIFVPPYVSPARDLFQPDVSYASPVGFVMHLKLNSTSVTSGSGILLEGWINSSYPSVSDINATDSWALPQSQLWGKICTSGWPIGLGIMQGHYTQDNYTLGTPVALPRPLTGCPAQAGAPADFLLRAHSSEALVTINGSPQVWNLVSSLGIGGSTSGRFPQGVYTAVLADEWGDVLTANFLVR